MNKTERELTAGYTRSEEASIKGDRTRNVVTFNPNSANPGETLYVDIPKLKMDSCLVPGSLHLVYDFVVSGVKTTFLNNLSAILQNRVQIKLAGETVYDCSGDYLYNTYSDLWKSTSERGDMIEYGVANENVRKLISNDDGGASSGNAQKVSDALMFTTYGTKQKLRLDRIIQDSGLYAPYRMNNNFQYIITLPKSDQILVVQANETLGSYELTNLQLEYETIENQRIADEVFGSYNVGRSLPYHHVTLFKSPVWDKGTTIVNDTINTPMKSLKAIVMLFTQTPLTDSEEFVYPNITDVRVSIDGVPNVIYSQGLKLNRFYEEAKRFFELNGVMEPFMSVDKFFKDKFALVIDLRTNEDIKTGHGKKIVNSQSGVQLQITKKATTKDVVCNIFVVGDGVVDFANGDLNSVIW